MWVPIRTRWTRVSSVPWAVFSGRTNAIAQRPNSLEQLGKADIKLQPVLAGFTASQFDRVAGVLIPPGERAARAHLAELAGLGVRAPEALPPFSSASGGACRHPRVSAKWP